VAVFAGDWQIGPRSDDIAALGLLGQSSSVTLTNGQALLQDIHIQHATAHLKGRVVDSFGAPVGNIILTVGIFTTNGPSPVQINPQTQPDGTFDVGVYGGNWNISLECMDSSQRGLVPPNISLTVVDGVDRTNINLTARNATGFITGSIVDKNGNPVMATAYATAFVNGTNYNACGGDQSSTFQIAVFGGTWQVGISGDMTSRGYDNPTNAVVNVTGTNTIVTLVLFPLGQTPPVLRPGGYVNGQFFFTLQGDPERMYRIEMTTNLNNPASWVALRTNTAFGGTFSFTDTNATIVPPRYYRAKLVP
jgi:hypothetical protein